LSFVYLTGSLSLLPITTHLSAIRGQQDAERLTAGAWTGVGRAGVATRNCSSVNSFIYYYTARVAHTTIHL